MCNDDTGEKQLLILKKALNVNSPFPNLGLHPKLYTYKQ
jgi:hypothetical protein